MKYRFVDILNEFLVSVGRNDLVNPQLDCHSTIELELDSAPAIKVDLETDDIVLWCNLDEFHSLCIDTTCDSLLDELPESTLSHFKPGQSALINVDGMMVFSAVMKEEAMVEPQLFAVSLEAFFACCAQLITRLTA